MDFPWHCQHVYLTTNQKMVFHLRKKNTFDHDITVKNLGLHVLLQQILLVLQRNHRKKNFLHPPGTSVSFVISPKQVPWECHPCGDSLCCPEISPILQHLFCSLFIRGSLNSWDSMQVVMDVILWSTFDIRLYMLNNKVIFLMWLYCVLSWYTVLCNVLSVYKMNTRDGEREFSPELEPAFWVGHLLGYQCGPNIWAWVFV